TRSKRDWSSDVCSSDLPFTIVTTRPVTPILIHFLAVSAALFSIGLLAALSRRHAIFILIGIEMMLAAANLNFVAFWRFSPATPRSEERRVGKGGKIRRW